MIEEGIPPAEEVSEAEVGGEAVEGGQGEASAEPAVEAGEGESVE